LKPEVAHTLSATMDWHDGAGEQWTLAFTPYLSYVDNYIDADPIGSFNPYMKMTETKTLLKFANHDAQLFGASLAGNWRMLRSAAWGDVTLRGKLDWMRGQRTDGGNLYHIMPPNANLTLESKRDALTAYAQWVVVASKQHVDARRDEDKTAGYALLNIGGSYKINKVLSVQVGVRNVFDRAYAQPLGGVNLAALKAGATSTLMPIQGQGRSVDVGMSISF
jgi:iron complex outermembrane recepter protein